MLHFVPFNMSAAPLDTNRSPGETSIPGRLTTTELRLLSCSLQWESTHESFSSFNRPPAWRGFAGLRRPHDTRESLLPWPLSRYCNHETAQRQQSCNQPTGNKRIPSVIFACLKFQQNMCTLASKLLIRVEAEILLDKGLNGSPHWSRELSLCAGSNLPALLFSQWQTETLGNPDLPSEPGAELKPALQSLSNYYSCRWAPGTCRCDLSALIFQTGSYDFGHGNGAMAHAGGISRQGVATTKGLLYNKTWLVTVCKANNHKPTSASANKRPALVWSG